MTTTALRKIERVASTSALAVAIFLFLVNIAAVNDISRGMHFGLSLWSMFLVGLAILFRGRQGQDALLPALFAVVIAFYAVGSVLL